MSINIMDTTQKIELINQLLEADSEFLESSEEDVNMIFSSDTSTDDFELEFEEHMVVTNFGTVISSFSDEDFKKHFRLNRLTVNWLIELYQTSDTVQSQQKGGRPCVGAQKEIHIFLWYVGNTNTFREIGNLFGISKSGAWNVIVKVSTWLISIGHQYVKWPSTEEVTSLMNQWEHKNKIPFVIGAIDSSHIRIKAPTENKECYFNRKHYYSVHLQAIVDIKKKFLDIFVGEPGSMHDSRVLRRSKLFWEAHANKNDTFPHNSLILGDSAYPHLEWLVPPFRDNGQLSNEEVQFNVLHSSARISVENAFGMLKTRFRRIMHFTEQISLNLVVNIIVSCCILHNICLKEDDDLPNIGELNDSDVSGLEQEQPPENTQINRRQQILNYLISEGVIVLRRN